MNRDLNWMEKYAYIRTYLLNNPEEAYKYSSKRAKILRSKSDLVRTIVNQELIIVRLVDELTKHEQEGEINTDYLMIETLMRDICEDSLTLMAKLDSSGDFKHAYDLWADVN